jgi:hypothetical protein
MARRWWEESSDTSGIERSRQQQERHAQEDRERAERDRQFKRELYEAEQRAQVERSTPKRGR